MYNLIAIVLERVQSNPVFSGGVGLGLLGLALAMLSAATLAILRFLLRRISVTVTVDSRAPAYRHLALWLSDSGALKRSRRFKIAQFAPPDRFLPPEDLNIVFSPAEGRHWFWRGGAPAWVEYHMERSVPGESVIGHSAPLESLTVCVFFRRRAVIERWIASGARLAGVRRLGGPRVFSVSRQGEWRERGEVRPRSIEGIVTNGDWAQRVLSDARDFLDREHWYASRGIPWRRGYLLYGPPGTGKSSLIRAIATELHLNVATLDLGRHALDESDLREAMADAPRNAILALEDIDAALNDARRAQRGAARKTDLGVSFSGLLNAIDGVAAQEGRLLFMTTNHRDALEPALVRPGRADMHVPFAPAGAAEAQRMFENVFPEHAELAGAFARAFGARRIAQAAIQGHLLHHVRDPELAIVRISELFEHAPLYDTSAPPAISRGWAAERVGERWSDGGVDAAE